MKTLKDLIDNYVIKEQWNNGDFINNEKTKRKRIVRRTIEKVSKNKKDHIN